jgi:hypothetical protein
MAEGMHGFVWEECGMLYQTPEAFLGPSGNYRSLCYMRPCVMRPAAQDLVR